MQEDLAKRILDLDLPIPAMVELWLCYRNAKPVSSLIVKDKPDADLNKIYKWISDAGLNYITNPGYNKDSYPLISVSYDKNSLEQLDKIIIDNSLSSTLKKGKLYGYPEKASKQLLKFWDDPEKYPMKGSSTLVREGFGDDFFYAQFMVREGYELEDGKQALEWAKIIRKDVPDLAKKYEAMMKDFI